MGTEIIALDFREVLAFIAALVAVCAWLFRLEAAVRTANTKASDVKEMMEKSEVKLEAKIEVLRAENKTAFEGVNKTLQEVIFRLADRNAGGKSDTG